MSRTRRDRPPNRPQVSDRDGSIRPGDKADAHDFALALQKSVKARVSRIADPVRLRSVLDFINSESET